MDGPGTTLTTYTTTRARDLARLAWASLKHRGRVGEQVQVHLARLRRDEERIRKAIGVELVGLDVLEVGAGQVCARASYFARNNRVTVVDLEETCPVLRLGSLARMWRANGLARVVKTLGRKTLGVDRRIRRAWRDALGGGPFPIPALVRADVQGPLPFASRTFDVIVSWSTFEHLPDPSAALRRLLPLLRPGGVLYVGIHLYTSISGHHDLRAFTGDGHQLPPWPHLRPSTRHLVRPSAYLNEWWLARWRALFASMTPGADEFLERYGEEELVRRLTPELRSELAAFEHDDLFTVEVFYRWRRPWS